MDSLDFVVTKILLAEDDRSLGQTIVDWLEVEKFFVDWEREGDMAMELLKSYNYDLIVLDWELPKLSGLDICKTYRARGGKSPVLFLTQRGNISDKESGFTAGADDYLPKPFLMKELSLRVKALLRRPAQIVEPVIRAGHLELHQESHKCFSNGTEVKLTPIEFALLEFFIKNAGTVFSAEAILDRVWPSSSTRSPETLRTCFKRLRQKIDLEGQGSMIQNVHGVGYRFDLPSVD
jgi:DNA-binding response OmpR family regulator